MPRINRAVLAALLCIAPLAAFAQNNELSFSLGGVFATSQTATTQTFISCPVTLPGCNIATTNFSSNAGFAFMGNFARRITAIGPATFYLEAPVVGGPGRDTNATFRSGTLLGDFVTLSSSSLFFTPSAKVRFLDSSRISPFATVGGGLAHLGFSGSNKNTGALQFGGGLDFKSPIPHLGFRAEARDFYSGGILQSSTFTHISPSHQHVVFVGGGVVFKF